VTARAAPRTPEPPSGEQVELRHGAHAVTVVEVGGGLRSYRLETWEVLDGYGREEMCSAARGQCLIPWPNRLRGGTYRFGGERHQVPLSEPARHNAIHGFVRWANWTVAERSEDCALMRYVLHPRAGYPFALLLEVEYALSRDGLAVRTTATNVGAGPCPYGAGAHPYLTVGPGRIDSAELRAPGRLWMPTDDQGIPTGELGVYGTEYDFRTPRPIGTTELDTGYANLERGSDGRARVEISSADHRRRVELWMDETYPYVMLFTGDSLEDPARRRAGLGVEPMTCAPNAFQSGDGLQVLEPEETWTTRWGIKPVAEHTT
jgi:aldose 1-epimerase